MLQQIADGVRAFANDADGPLAAARQLDSALRELADASMRLTGAEASQVRTATGGARTASRSVTTALVSFQLQATAFADRLASGGAVVTTPRGDTVAPSIETQPDGSDAPTGAGGVNDRSPLVEQRKGENEWAPGTGDSVPPRLAQVAAHTPPAEWAALINEPGMSTPGRNNNCVDCARAVESTWRGTPATSAAMRNSSANGTAAVRITEWAGGKLVPTNFDGVAARLQQLGEGSSAIIVSSWPRGGGHAYNAVNDGGMVKFIDGQSGTVSDWPPASWKESATSASWAVFFTEDGEATKQ